MTRLEQIRNKALKTKAANLLNKKFAQVVSVTEGQLFEPTSVELKNGNRLHIPFEVWVG